MNILAEANGGFFKFDINTLLIVFIFLAMAFQPIVTRFSRRVLGKKAKAYDQLSQVDKDLLIARVEDAVRVLSREKIGALITLERKDSLDEYIKSGHQIDAITSASLLRSIFVKDSPLHDGSVIIRGTTLVCSSAYFPTTTKRIDASLGSRHRAAVGASESADAIIVIVSETNGQISFAKAGELYKTDLTNFAATLKAMW